MDKNEIDALTMAGRCSDGAQRDGGRRFHAVPRKTFSALCGAKPGRQSVGWSQNVHPITAVTCPRCLARLERAETPRKPSAPKLAPDLAAIRLSERSERATGAAVEAHEKAHGCRLLSGCAMHSWLTHVFAQTIHATDLLRFTRGDEAHFVAGGDGRIKEWLEADARQMFHVLGMDDLFSGIRAAVLAGEASGEAVRG